ncbi:MAG: hypothetical protein GY822_15950, partial [Deltaproteobacteria bacterium]|nr:hypothetical protein [Deltaproteobacteria bacterium]
GLNKYGQLGNSTQDDSNVPVRVSNANGFVNGSVAQVSAGGSKNKGHTCAVTTDGAAYCWGSNQYGQLGNGLNTKSLEPVKVVSGDEGFVNGSVRQVSAGKSYTCAVTTGNTAYCWGKNDSGQLGNRTNTKSPVPVLVVNGTQGFVNGSVQEVSAGFEHTCALTGDTGTGGTVYCWGQNSQGQLGSGRPLSLVPVKVDPGSQGFVNGSVRQVSVGSEHTCAVTDAGAAYCWGKNGYGRLGNDSEVNSAVPVRVSTANGFVNGQVDQVSAGDYHTCAVTTGNTVYCWGRDNDEQLGNGLNTKSLVPVKVVDGTEGFVNGQVDQVSAGEYHTCAVTTGNTAYCWGKNDSGQLGNGTNTKSPVPVLVAGQLRVVPNPVEFGTVDAGSSK